MIFKLMVNFKPADTWEAIFLLVAQVAWKKTSESNQLLVQTDLS